MKKCNENILVAILLFFNISTCNVVYAQDKNISDNIQDVTAESKKLIGIWEGKLKNIMNYVITIREKPDKTFDCNIRIPPAPPFVPVSFSVSDKSFKLVMPMTKMILEGTLDNSGSQIEAALTMGDKKINFPLNKVEKETPVLRAQTPVPPFSYEEKEIEFTNKKDGIKLSGSLTYPKTGSNFPCAILISGSGPQDRNEEGFDGHRFFQVLADDLTKRGIAVLRFDDRGTGKSAGNFSSSSVFDFANDAEAGLDYLQTIPFINKYKIGFIGHSEGGQVAEIIASRRNEAAFIILMAGPVLSNIECLKYSLKQLDSYLKASGSEKDDSNFLLKMVEILSTEKYSAVIKEKLTSILKDMKLPNDLIENMVNSYTSADFISSLHFPTEEFLSKIKCPILVLGGSKDTSVPAKENLETLKQIMGKLGRSNYETVEFPNMNHFFQTTTNGMFYFVPQIKETMSPIAMKTMGEWILKVTGK